VFVLAVAVACMLAGAKNFREIGDQAADLPQEVLRRLGGTRHPLRHKIIAPGEKRIRTLVHALGADALDGLIGGWLRDTAYAEDANTGYAGNGPQVMATLPGIWPSACSTSPASPRSPAPPRPSDPRGGASRQRARLRGILPDKMRRRSARHVVTLRVHQR
jgi:hypothetical protein